MDIPTPAPEDTARAGQKKTPWWTLSLILTCFLWPKKQCCKYNNIYLTSFFYKQRGKEVSGLWQRYFWKLTCLIHPNFQEMPKTNIFRLFTSRLLTDPRGPWVETVDSLTPGAAGKSGATAPEENWLLKQTNFMAFGGQLSSFEYRIYIRNNFFQYDSRIAVM